MYICLKLSDTMRELLIADKQEITRLGIKQLAGTLDGFGVVEEVSNKKKLQELLNKYPKAVVILDYNLFDFSSFEELERYLEEFEQTDWILFSDDLSDSFIKNLVIDKSYFCILLKSDTLIQIRKALTAAIENETFVSKQIMERIENFSRLSEKSERILTNTEREILKEIASGKMTKVIALEKNLSIHTITTHRKNIFKKLEINNVHDAIRYAIKAGIIAMDDYTI